MKTPIHKKTQQSLDGVWRLKGTKPGESPLEFDATLPSHVHQTLEENGIIPDHNFGYNAEQCQWVEDWCWTYSRTFSVDDPKKTRHYLVFEGLDTYAEIFLNGEKLAKTENMFVEHRFEVTGLLQDGENFLSITFHPIKEEIKDFPLDQYASIFTYDRVFTRRMQCTYSWDWVHRFVSYGVYKTVYIESFCDARIDSMYVATRSLSEHSAHLYVSAALETETESWVQIKIFDPAGTLVVCEKARVNHNQLELFPSIEHPRLWWPATHGEQPLYTLEITLIDQDENILDTLSQKFGIRTIVIEQIMDSPGSKAEALTKRIRDSYSELESKNIDVPGRSFAIVINGRRVFLRGANWVPASPFPASNSRDRYTRFVRLAVDANINVLRVWGGGLYAPDELLKACDELGVLLTQDFLMACGAFPIDDTDFENNLKYEFPLAIKRLRNHACLAWYNGDNELGMQGDFDDPEYNGRAIFDRVTRPSLRAHDPYRDFIPTSPFGGRPNTSLTIGNTHYTNFLMDEINRIRDTDLCDYRQYFNNQLSRFVSEAMSFGAPSIPSLKMFMGDDLDDKRMLDFHTKNHPFLKDFSLYDAAAMMSEKILGEGRTSEERILKIGYVQYEWVRLLVESHRRNQWYSSGIIFWMYNDIWAASGWALVDHYGFPKAGYYGMKKAASPILVSIEETQHGWDVYVVNDTADTISGSLTMFLEPFNANHPRVDLSTVPFDVSTNCSAKIFALEKSKVDGIFDNHSMLIAEIFGEFGKQRTYCPSGMPKDMVLENVTLNVERVGNENGFLKISTDHYARIVCLEGDFDFEDNYFDILPRSSVEIRFSNAEGSMDRNMKGLIRVYALNGSGPTVIEFSSR